MPPGVLSLLDSELRDDGVPSELYLNRLDLVMEERAGRVGLAAAAPRSSVRSKLLKCSLFSLECCPLAADDTPSSVSTSKASSKLLNRRLGMYLSASARAGRWDDRGLLMGLPAPETAGERDGEEEEK